MERRADRTRPRGSWGFEDGKYDISMDCGEHATILPAGRDADDETLIIANGFSCRTQIEQAGTGRVALHTAQAIQLARASGGAAASGHPEDACRDGRPRPGAAVTAARVVGSVLTAAAGLGAARAVAARLRR